MFSSIITGRFAAAAVLMAALSVGTAGLAEESADSDDVMRVFPFDFGGFGPFGAGARAMTRPIDTNQDGLVSASEASQHASTGFALFDSDGDDQITEDEYMDSAPQAMSMLMLMSMGRRNTERLYVNRIARFAAMDADGDAVITLAEFMAKAQASYEAADTNDDANVTVWEFRSQQSPF